MGCRSDVVEILRCAQVDVKRGLAPRVDGVVGV
jgi:hypothetical protein